MALSKSVQQSRRRQVELAKTLVVRHPDTHKRFAYDVNQMTVAERAELDAMSGKKRKEALWQRPQEVSGYVRTAMTMMYELYLTAEAKEGDGRRVGPTAVAIDKSVDFMPDEMTPASFQLAAHLVRESLTRAGKQLYRS